MASFAIDAVVVDEGSECRGESIRQWAVRFLRRVDVYIRPINASKIEGKVHLAMIVATGDVATSEEFDWEISVAGDKVATLIVRRTKQPELSDAVEAYVRATNSFDLDALLATFAENAVVNDQLQEHWGREAIRKWAAHDIVGARVTMCVVNAVKNNGNVVVTAKVDGDYDKRGLPDPLVLTFYFSTVRGKIVQLVVLRNEPNL